MLSLQKFLSDNQDDLAKLSTEYGIFSKQHNNYPDLYQFTYDQISSSKIKDHPMVRESRGIILDRANDWKVISRPFDRFFNWGEDVNDGDTFDWSSFIAQEKIDGSLLILYYYAGKWNVATKGSPTANGTVGDNRFTFADLFWRIFWEMEFHKEYTGFEYTYLDVANTYLFELTSQYNRIVTTQLNNDGKLTLIGVRDTQTGIESPVELYREWFDVVRSFPMTTIEEILLAAKELDPSQQEGFVLVDKNFNRIKVKSEKYVLIHHLKNCMNDIRIIELIRTGEDSELFAYFPDIKIRFDEIKIYLDRTENLMDDQWNSVIVEEKWLDKTQKEFALFVQKTFNTQIHSYFYMRRSGKINTAADWFNNIQPEKVLDIIVQRIDP